MPGWAMLNVVRSLVGAARSFFRTQRALALENLALRHPVGGLKRSLGKRRCSLARQIGACGLPCHECSAAGTRRRDCQECHPAQRTALAPHPALVLRVLPPVTLSPVAGGRRGGAEARPGTGTGTGGRASRGRWATPSICSRSGLILAGMSLWQGLPRHRQVRRVGQACNRLSTKATPGDLQEAATVRRECKDPSLAERRKRTFIG
jgi:hypothetical protein